jgi:glucokinase
MVLTNNGALIGVDLGGTKVAAGRIDGAQLGEVVYKLIPANSNDPRDIINVIIEVIDKLFDEQVLGIGIGIPGLVDREEGIVNDVQNIPSWKEVHLGNILETHFNVPVYLDNDANCFALGESRFGKGKNEDDFVGLTLGTGMGGGIIKDGFLISDAHCGSGEFGNIPYLNSIYEDYCSGKFFISEYGFKGEELTEAASQGDKLALKAFDEFGKHLGNAIKTIKLAVDPRKVIIGGSVAQASEFFVDSMWKSISDFPFPRAMRDFEVIFSDVKNIAVLGAASLYLDRTKQRDVEEAVATNQEN